MPILAFLIPLGISALSMPLIIFISKRHGFFDQVNHRKVHVGDVSRLGGVGIFIALLATMALFSLVPGFLPDELLIGLPLLLWLGGVALVHLMGVLDDIKNLKALIKLGIQILGATLIAFAGIQVTGFMIPPSSIWFDFGFFSLPLTILWVISISNAINLFDGLDGLAGSTSFFAALCFACIHGLHGNIAGLMISLSLAGAVAGFLLFNRPKAALFMGDGGAYLLGIVLASLPLIPSDFLTATHALDFVQQLNLRLPQFSRAIPDIQQLDVLVGLMVLLLPTADMLAAILRRARRHLPIYTPDREHLHHKLMDFGFNNWQILGFVTAFNLGFGGLGFLASWSRAVLPSFFSWLFAGIFALLAGIIAVTLFSVIHTANKARKSQSDA